MFDHYNNIKEINISSENIYKYGFVCFHYPEENFVKDDSFSRKIDISTSLNHQKYVLFYGSKDDLKLLSKEKLKRVVYQDTFKIFNDPDNSETMHLLSARAGWNQTEKDIKEFTGFDTQSVFFATFNDNNVSINLGCGDVFPVNTYVSWIGMILVHTELRRQGIAAEIVKKCLKYSRLVDNKEIIGLDATLLGMPLYKQLGFKSSFSLWLTKISKKETLVKRNDIEIKKLLEIESCNSYIKKRGGTDRQNILYALQNIDSAGNFIAISKGRIVGLLMSRPGRLLPFIGLLVADSDIIATILLDHCLAYWKTKGKSELFMMIPEFHFKKTLNRESVNLIFKLPFDAIPLRKLIRMYHLISDDDKIKKMTNNAIWNKILDHGHRYFAKTEKYLQNEKSKFLPHLYSIGGPEVS